MPIPASAEASQHQIGGEPIIRPQDSEGDILQQGLVAHPELRGESLPHEKGCRAEKSSGADGLEAGPGGQDLKLVQADASRQAPAAHLHQISAGELRGSGHEQSGGIPLLVRRSEGEQLHHLDDIEVRCGRKEDFRPGQRPLHSEGDLVFRSVHRGHLGRGSHIDLGIQQKGPIDQLDQATRRKSAVECHFRPGHLKRPIQVVHLPGALL